MSILQIIDSKRHVFGCAGLRIGKQGCPKKKGGSELQQSK
jgi:hypothetical protein